MSAVLAAMLAAFGLIGLGAWRNFWLSRAGRAAPSQSAPTAPVRLGNGLLAVAPAAAAALEGVRTEAARALVRLEIAVHPGLAVRIDAGAFDRILSDMLLTAIRTAPCGRVLVSARRLGGRVEIAVSGDGATADRDRLIADLRSSIELLALHGGTLDVQTIPDAGTIFAARLLEPQGTGAMKLADVAPPRPQSEPAPAPEPARSRSRVAAGMGDTRGE